MLCESPLAMPVMAAALAAIESSSQRPSSSAGRILMHRKRSTSSSCTVFSTTAQARCPASPAGEQECRARATTHSRVLAAPRRAENITCAHRRPFRQELHVSGHSRSRVRRPVAGEEHPRKMGFDGRHRVRASPIVPYIAQKGDFRGQSCRSRLCHRGRMKIRRNRRTCARARCPERVDV